MKNRLISSIALPFIMVLLLTGCAKIPQLEIDAANAAVEQAKIAGADIYIYEDYLMLQDSLRAVVSTIESQKSKLSRSNKIAKKNLADVKQFAGEVQQKTEIRKGELKEEIQNTIAEVKALVESNRQLILEAPRGKEGTSALVAIKGEIDAVETSIIESDTLFNAGDYLATINKVKAAKEKATAINTELSEVIAKFKTNVKGRKT